MTPGPTWPAFGSFEPHRISVAELWTRLASSAAGLTEADVRERLEHEGPNRLSEAPPPALFLRFARHLRHRFAILLWAGAALALVGEHFSPGEGMALIAAALASVVLLNAGFSFWQELRVEQAMAAFRGMLAQHARVLRDGSERDIDASDIVVGDVVVLREGDRVPADGRLFEANALKVDNSPLTGESEPQLRTTEAVPGARISARNLAFFGTLVTTGTGKALIYATGNHTEIGRIAGATRETTRVDTPIHKQLQHFIATISRIAVGLGLGFFLAGWAIGNPFWTNLVFAIGIIVANVPEGLLPSVTLALAIAGRKMAKRNALLKSLESAETLGSTTVICTDKTGTLTQNAMRVTDVLSGPSTTSGRAREVAYRVMALCNNATLSGSGASAECHGDPTETALLHGVEAGEPGTVANLRRTFLRLFEHPFDSATKEMATVHQIGDGREAVLKGAPEVVLSQCSAQLLVDDVQRLDDVARTGLREQANALARSGKRVLGLARRDVTAAESPESVVHASDWEFVALVAMQDPPRPRVAESVAQCRAAGIRVIVISGDHPLTVEAIAREVGIVASPRPRVYTSEDLERWSPAALRKALESAEVLFARASPLHKLRVVTALQEMGHVVAVTGDGVNDAPALKRADVGVAMGKSGTDVAREAADMVLMDDDFSTIVAAVQEGRVIYGNIRRFIGYVLTSNVPEILPYVAFVLLGIPLPLSVLLILAIDLGTDMAPAIALANESAESDVMRQPPRARGERLLSPGLLLSSYLLWGMLESAAGFASYAWVLHQGGWSFGATVAGLLHRQAITAFFLAVIFCQLANLLVWRTTTQSSLRKGLLDNRGILFGVAIELGIASTVVFSPAGNALFDTAVPPWPAFLVPLPFAAGMLLLSEAVKVRRRRR
ncbi:MAG: cation-transporting P-type ATPase [Polyangiaceae bacterium]